MSKDLGGEDLADYAVCPEAWRLKSLSSTDSQRTDHSESSSLKKEWTASAELRQQLRKYAKITFALLATLTGGILLLDSFGFTSQITRQTEVSPSRDSIFSVPTDIGLLLLVVGLLIFIWDLLDRRATSIQKKGGLAKNAELLSAKGSNLLPAKTLRSKSRGLISKPFALFKEDRNIIPVDVYPMTNKIQDRHVLPLLLHLDLLEEINNDRPPYGVLLMGKKQKRIQVLNSEKKTRWLHSILDEMHSIQDGVPAVPTPTMRKCQNCDVEKICPHSLLKQNSQSKARPRKNNH